MNKSFTEILETNDLKYPTYLCVLKYILIALCVLSACFCVFAPIIEDMNFISIFEGLQKEGINPFLFLTFCIIDVVGCFLPFVLYIVIKQFIMISYTNDKIKSFAIQELNYSKMGLIGLMLIFVWLIIFSCITIFALTSTFNSFIEYSSGYISVLNHGWGCYVAVPLIIVSTILPFIQFIMLDYKNQYVKGNIKETDVVRLLGGKGEIIEKSNSLEDKLLELNKLKENGLITEQEYANLRKEALGLTNSKNTQIK